MIQNQTLIPDYLIPVPRLPMDKKTAFALVLGLLTTSGLWLLKISTPSGLGLTDDAISYIAASRALLAGQGFTRIWLATGLEPITHWPPAFSATLAAISLLLKIDPYRSARVLNILVFGANAGILGLLGYKITKSHLASILLSTLFLSNPALLRLHAQALSEPLYIFINLLAFLAFYRAFENTPILAFPRGGKEQVLPPPGGVRGGQGHKWLIITGIFTGISYLTRYAALSLIATFIVAVFLLFPTWKKRLISLAYFLAGVLPFTLGWTLRNKLVGGTATNRAIEWHSITPENILRGLREFFNFLLPLPEFSTPFLNKTFFLAIIPIFISFFLLMWVFPQAIKYFLKPDESKKPEVLPFITILYIFSYMGALLVSLSFFDAATPLNSRILSPVYVAFFMILVYFIHKLSQQGKITLRFFALILTFFFLSTSILAQIHNIEDLQKSPTGFASWRWRESTIMEAIRNLPEGVDVYTNQPTATYFWVESPVYRLWDEQPEDIRNGDAVLAIFFPANDKSPKFQIWLAMMTEGLEQTHKSGLGYLYSKK